MGQCTQSMQKGRWLPTTLGVQGILKAALLENVQALDESAWMGSNTSVFMTE